MDEYYLNDHKLVSNVLLKMLQIEVVEMLLVHFVQVKSVCGLPADMLLQYLMYL